MSLARHFATSAAMLALGAFAHADEWNGRTCCVAPAGDVDADGTTDLMIASLDAQPGRVWILSGRDGRVIHVLRGADDLDGFGSTLCPVGDIDRDGHDDFVIGANGAHPALRDESLHARKSTIALPYLCLISGRTGLAAWWEDSASRVCLAGDYDGDGIADLVTDDRTALARVTGATLVSARTGAILGRVELPRGGVGNAFASPGDIDGDATPDFVVGDTESHGQGGIYLYSGCTLQLLAYALGDRPTSGLGSAFATLGDVDGDGVVDLAISTETEGVDFRSGWSLRRIRRGARAGDAIATARATSLSAVGDVDGDGAGDFVVSSNESRPACFHEGYAWLVSGSTGRVLRHLATSRVQGIDASDAGDIDGDGIHDVAVVRVVTRELDVLSGRNGTMLRYVQLDRLPRNAERASSSRR